MKYLIIFLISIFYLNFMIWLNSDYFIEIFLTKKNRQRLYKSLLEVNNEDSKK